MRATRVIAAVLGVEACRFEDRSQTQAIATPRGRAPRAAIGLALVAVGLGDCGQPARGGDATVDAVPEGGDGLFDARPDGDAGAPDADAGAPDADAALDAADEGADAAPDVDLDAFTACNPDAATALPGLGQSCAPDSGVDPRYCEEAHYCGGTYTMGQGGWELWGYSFRQIQACDIHTAAARSGFIDTYEVTVARFRQWMQAGLPHPAVGEVFFNGMQWTAYMNNHLVLPDQEWDGRHDRCTYTALPGPNDERPVTCATLADAIAFCWWDGKHLATEVGWEYVARNQGTTDTVPGVSASALMGSAACPYGDVEGPDGTCPWETMPGPVGSHPEGDTLDPLGVHDLFGGVREMTIGLPGLYNHDPAAHDSTGAGTCVPGAPPAPLNLDGDFGAYLDRGACWMDRPFDLQYSAHAATRSPTGLGPGIDEQNGQSASEGIRCMRWEQEPR